MLYQAIQAIQQSTLVPKGTKIIIYSGSNKSAQEILEHVQERFGITINPHNMIFSKLENAHTLKPDLYPSFTMFW